MSIGKERAPGRSVDCITWSAPPTERIWQRFVNQGSKERSRTIILIGCDFHTRFQQIAMRDPTTSDIVGRRLEDQNYEGRGFAPHFPNPLGWAMALRRVSQLGLGFVGRS